MLKNPRNHSLCTQEEERERKSKGDVKCVCVCGGGLDSQGHLNKHKTDAELVELVCEHETGVSG